MGGEVGVGVFACKGRLFRRQPPDLSPNAGRRGEKPLWQLRSTLGGRMDESVPLSAAPFATVFICIRRT